MKYRLTQWDFKIKVFYFSLYPLPPPPNTAATKSISTPIDPLTPRPFTPTRTTEEILSDLLKSVADAQNHGMQCSVGLDKTQ